MHSGNIQLLNELSRLRFRKTVREGKALKDMSPSHQLESRVVISLVLLRVAPGFGGCAGQSSAPRWSELSTLKRGYPAR